MNATTCQLVNDKYEYVSNVQEGFWIVSYTTDHTQARKFYTDHADEVIKGVKRITNGHVELRKVS
jgi:hypothetical protein